MVWVLLLLVVVAEGPTPAAVEGECLEVGRLMLQDFPGGVLGFHYEARS